MKSRQRMAIGELAALYGLAPHVLRHWEQMGLLTPARAPGGRRVYGPVDATRIALILLAKEAGLTLEQTRYLLAEAADKQARATLYQQHGELLRGRIAAAQESLAIIEHAAACHAEDITVCPQLREKVAARLPAGLRPDGGAWPASD
ncbi:MerR family transcriptional regulator [Micromonospora andamanensis]|uniref:MerR family transcriptional regulator n=1 Tax=Micromonospora andamanensis TaxID=1287068 RepID=UPI00194F3397|nr:MerR family transcriptional regulator [Micromonospora andamanensis]